jgi:hypothetical protein
MNVKDVLVSQYEASLLMLKNTIAASDTEIWTRRISKKAFWHVAYHTLFYTDFYLSKDEKTFVPWVKHKNECQFLGPVPWPPHNEPHIGEPYTQTDLLECWDSIHDTLVGTIEKTDLESPSGFYWLPFNKLELQIYNIRHIQHHTGQLAERIREQRNVGVQWVSKGEAQRNPGKN